LDNPNIRDVRPKLYFPVVDGCRGVKPVQSAKFLPVPYAHLVFTLPTPVAAIAYQNKAEVYGPLFRAAAETLATIASDRRHLGVRIGFTSVLHTWGSAMTHHPHLHIIAPGGGLSPHGSRWIACKPGFFLPCACSRGCSDVSSSKGSLPCMRPGDSPSMAISPI